jgi:TonB family protein
MSYQALLFCPDEKTARVVTQVLTELDFTIEPCNETFAAVKKLMAQHFDAIVVDCDNEQNATLLFKSARNSAPNQSSLSVAVVEGQSGVAKAFRIGANLVLTKPINVEQSKGTLRVARGLLRKADATKPATINTPAPQAVSPSAPSFEALRPTATSPFAERSEKPAVPFATAAAKQSPGTPDITAAGFEVEEEEGPKPEAAEAALLESMADPRAAKLPWQQVTMPAPGQEPAVANPAAKAVVQAPAPQKPSLQPLGFGESKKNKDAVLSSPSSGAGSAAAAAPARETSRASGKVADTRFAAPEAHVVEPASTMIASTAPVVEAPMFSGLAVKDHEAEAQASSKKPFFFAVAAVVLIAVGYFGWSRLNVQQGQTAAQSSAAQLPVAVPQVSPAPVSGAVAGEANTVTANPQGQMIAPDTTHSIQSGTTIASSAKPPAGSRFVANEPTPSVNTSTSDPSAQQAMVVKNPSPQPINPRAVSAEAAPAAAPPMLDIAGSTEDNAIAGIVSSVPARVPRPAGQTMKISQGVSQGLLVKRVQPVYPSQAMQMRLQGAVVLEATIGKDGSITRVKRVTGDALLARSAADAVKQWKYKPYYLNGEPVEINTEITVNFKLP